MVIGNQKSISGNKESSPVPRARFLNALLRAISHEVLADYQRSDDLATRQLSRQQVSSASCPEVASSSSEIPEGISPHSVKWDFARSETVLVSQFIQGLGMSLLASP